MVDFESENGKNEDILGRVEFLENEVLSLKNVIIKQNNIIKKMAERIVELSEDIISLKNDLFNVSTGNHRVKQSINQSINQTLSTPINDQKAENAPQNLDFRQFQAYLDQTFKNISKQELKTFLTVYQLEDEKIEPSYTEIATRIGLSENCTRAYISNLFKKEIPIERKKVNNKKSLFFINPDFRILNLKNLLVKIYYDLDPAQSTLFDTKS